MATRKKRRKKRKNNNRKGLICLALLSVAFIFILVLIFIYAGKVKNDFNTTQVNQVNNDKTTEQTDGVTTVTESVADSEIITEAVVVNNDTTPPVITGEANIYVARGSKVKYKSYIHVTDDCDPDPKIEIDNSNVDLSKEGTYVVIYTVTDSAGNVATKAVNVVVGAEEEPNVDDETIYALADQILANIITDGMSDLDKVFAVFFFVRDTYTYVKDDNYWEYKQEAYHMMTEMQDNCYANVCVSKLLLERLGFESFMIQGELGYLDEHHYWNMVSIDGGKSWYHYDAAWWTWMNDEYPMCMMTDAFAQSISDRHGGLLIYDHSAYPATPTQDLWTPEERGYTSAYVD